MPTSFVSRADKHLAVVSAVGVLSLLAVAACTGKGQGAAQGTDAGADQASQDDLGAPDQPPEANADAGQPDTAPAPLCAKWKSEVIAPAGSYRDYRLALAIHDDVPHVAFMRSDQSLVYGVRGTGGWQLTEVANEASVGLGLDLAVDSDGHPHLAYLGVDGTDYSLRHSWLDGGGSWQTEVVEMPATGLPAALVFDATGTLHVAYSAAKRGRHAWKAVAATSWTFEDLSAGTPTDMVFANNLLHVLISNQMGLAYAVQNQNGWETDNVMSTPATNARQAVSDSAVYVAANSDTWATWWSAGLPAAGQTWSQTTLQSVTGLDVVYGMDVALDGRGVPHAVYSYETGSPAIYSPVVLARFIHGQWTRETAWSPSYAEHPRFQLDSQGRPHIVFIFFSVSRSLYYLSCAS